MSDAPAPSAEALVAELVALLDVEPKGAFQYQGSRKPGGVGRVFGGQVIAQALASAIKTVDAPKQVHSLHAYFMRAGDEDYPIDFRVEADFDGGSFSNRRVVAMQKGLPILNLVASFQRPEAGLAHQAPMPDVPPPESLKDLATVAREGRDALAAPLVRLFSRPNAIDLRPVGLIPFLRTEKSDPSFQMWFRLRAPLDAGQDMHRLILAHASDYTLLSTAMLPHGLPNITQKLQAASLDHALWFHEDVKVDDWLLYSTDSPWSGHARGFNRGMIFSRDGTLVASCSQEGLIRLRR